MSDYKPGTVAVATVRGVPNVTAFRLRERTWVTGREIQRTRLHHDEDVTDVRPLVVLDLPHAGITAKMLRASAENESASENRRVLRQIADQIAAQTKPPKPPEPTGLGAVVEGAEGERWVRVYGDGTPEYDCWKREHYTTRHKWSEVDAVRILSKGVRP